MVFVNSFPNGFCQQEVSQWIFAVYISLRIFAVCTRTYIPVDFCRLYLPMDFRELFKFQWIFGVQPYSYVFRQIFDRCSRNNNDTLSPKYSSGYTFYFRYLKIHCASFTYICTLCICLNLVPYKGVLHGWQEDLRPGRPATASNNFSPQSVGVFLFYLFLHHTLLCSSSATLQWLYEYILLLYHSVAL